MPLRLRCLLRPVRQYLYSGAIAAIGAGSLRQFSPANAVWEKDGHFFDALRPSVEPEGFERPEQVLRHRQYHLHRVRQVFASVDLFIFTFGLTESWIDKKTGTVYPTAPGTLAGRFDPEIFTFKNFSFGETYECFIAFRELLRERNPNIKFLLTVSPVSLTATASGQHVL